MFSVRRNTFFITQGFHGAGIMLKFASKINKSWGSFDGYINKTGI